MPAGVETDVMVGLGLERATVADPQLARLIGSDVDDAVTSLPRLIARSAPPRRLAVVAASERALAPLGDAARRSGWQVTAASPERVDPLGVTSSLLDPSVDAVLVGAGEPPGADERRSLDDVAALVAAAAARRPELTIVLAGAMSERLERFEAAGEQRQGELLLAPAATSGDPVGLPLRELLEDLRAPADDSRRAIARAAAALADALDRRVEI